MVNYQSGKGKVSVCPQGWNLCFRDPNQSSRAIINLPPLTQACFYLLLKIASGSVGGERFSVEFCLVLCLLKATEESSSWCQSQRFVLFFHQPEKCPAQTGPWPPTPFTWATIPCQMAKAEEHKIYCSSRSLCLSSAFCLAQSKRPPPSSSALLTLSLQWARGEVFPWRLW